MDNQLVPVLALKNIILFPSSEIRLELTTNEEKTLISLCESMANKEVIIVQQKENLQDKMDIMDLPDYGVLGNITMKLDLPNGKTKVVIKGIDRIGVSSYKENEGTIFGIYQFMVRENLEDFELIAYSRTLIKKVEEYVNSVSYISNSILAQINDTHNLDDLTDIVCIFLPTSYEKKLEYIKETKSSARLKMLLDDLNTELKVIELEQNIENNLQGSIEKSQKDFILHEKIKVIKEELGEINNKDDEVNQMRNKMKNLNLPKKIYDRLNNEINKYETCTIASPEISIIRNYIDWLLSLPWNKESIDNKDLNQVLNSLNKTHYGLEKLKDRIIEYLAVKQYSKKENAPIICLLGPPGVGKTSFAKSIAKALNRRFCKISVGGVNDEAEIVGHRRTYIGAEPGRIIQGIKRAGTKNPVFIIDEIDKMNKDIKGDPASSLLEVLDKEQNKYFSDHYIEEEFDLSKVMFICTANYIEQIPYELYDRLEIIEMSSYTEYEKLSILKNHILKKALIENGLKLDSVFFSDDAILTLIRNYTKEAGVRELERVTNSVLRKIVKDKVLNKKLDEIVVIEKGSLEKYLGPAKFNDVSYIHLTKIGVVNGLSYTIFGGDVLPIEVCYYKGNGNLKLTGSLGDVFKESAEIALSYIKSHANEFNIDFNILNETDFHIHVPEGAIKKEGPSAGVTITTAFLSAILKKEILVSIAMTGEITLTGEILPIGGLREKLLGAKRNNIKTVFLPEKNKNDFMDLDEEVKRNITIIFVKNYMEIFERIGIKDDRDKKRD